MAHIEDIYRRENNSFRLNMGFGFILRNRLTNEYRYYIEYGKNQILSQPFTLTRYGSLRALKNKIKKINPEKYMKEHSPNSKW